MGAPSSRLRLGIMVAGALALCGLFVVTRLPLYMEHFFNTDAVQLGLALDRFDLPQHQPHPPGYLLYVLLARGLHALGATPEHAYQLLATLMSALGIAGTYLLATRLFSRRAGVIAAVASLFHPYVWAYGVVGESYAAEYAATTWIGILCIEAWRGPAGVAVVAGLLLGLCGGIRTSITMFLFPLFLCALWRGALSWRVRLCALLAFGAGTAAWFAPTAALAGGVGEWMRYTRGLTFDFVARYYSPLFGTDPQGALLNVTRLLWWSAIVLAPLGIPALFFALLRRRDATAMRAPILPRKPYPAVLLALWTTPAFLFYLLVFAAKPGYTLTFYAPMAACMAGLIDRGIARLGARRTRFAAVMATTAATAAGAALFLFTGPGEGDRVGISLAHLAAEEALLGRALEVARHEETRAGGPGRAGFVVDLWLPDWRRFAYYYPQAPSWMLVSRATFPGAGELVFACAAQGGRQWCPARPQDIVPRTTLPSEVTRLVSLSGGREAWLTAAFRELAGGAGPIAFESDGFRYEAVDLRGGDVRLGPFELIRTR